ncbi:MAG: hypothetical protein CMC70_05000 [Flavobacteriaceae bacterium]|nr:hypothetical protein [Flavobacteriaceae bacterium]|tara:strand:- start:885 stop:1322 length:438 start_codon:yes stop_codon:yes gene_type:complete
MKNKLLNTLFLIISLSCFAQQWDSDEFIRANNYQEVIGDINEDDKRKPDVYAMYPDGKKGIYTLIANETLIPRKAIKENISGTVILKYVVGKDGYITDIEVVQSVSKHLDKASIKVLKLMERWIPGKENGKNVRVEYRQPFRFNL